MKTSGKVKFLLFLWLLLTAAVTYNTFTDERGLANFWQMRQLKKNLEVEIEQLSAENVDLQAKIYALKTDPFYTEKIAREQLGFVYPGETVIYLNEDNNKANSSK